jgi:hypothetical protein
MISIDNLVKDDINLTLKFLKIPTLIELRLKEPLTDFGSGHHFLSLQIYYEAQSVQRRTTD